MSGSLLDDFRNELIIHPLVFSDQAGKYDNMKYVKPNYISKNKPPITAHDVKEIKTYLNAIMKSQSNFYKAKRKFRNAFVKAERKAEERGGNYCNNFNFENFERELMARGHGISYDPMSNKSLRNAIRLAEQKAKNYKKTEKVFYAKFQEYIEYLRYLKDRKQVRSAISLTELQRTSITKLQELLDKLNFPQTETELQKYIPSKLREVLQGLELDRDNRADEFAWADVLGDVFNEIENACKSYEKSCVSLMEVLEEAYHDFEKEDVIDGSKLKGLKLHEEIQVLIYDEKKKDRKMSIKTSRQILAMCIRNLSVLIESSHKAIETISPFADELYKSAIKSKIRDLITLYTRLSDSLSESAARLTHVMTKLSGGKKQILSVSVGLDKVYVGKEASAVTDDWHPQFSAIDCLNLDSAKCCTKLEMRKIFRDVLELRGLFTSVSTKLKDLSKSMISNTSREGLAEIKENLLRLDDESLKLYTEKVVKSLEEATVAEDQFKEVYEDSKKLLENAKKSLFGKLILYKEAHRVELDTLKMFADTAQKLVAVL